MADPINIPMVVRKYRWFSHVVFWTVVWLFFALVESRGHHMGSVLVTELISVLFYVALIYFNLNYLIPLYLTEKKFWLYCILLLLAVFIMTPVKIIVLHFRFAGMPEAQSRLLTGQQWIFISNFLITGGSTIYKIISDWIRHQREKKELEKQTMQSELRFLKSQINPHFLFNTLNNLYALTLKKSDLAPEIVLKLSEMMRYMLYECNEKRVPLSKEVAYMQNYLELEKLRQGKGVTITFEVEGDITDQQISPLLLIPFLENSFKHGLKSQIKEGFVHIRMWIQGKELEFEIINTKPPLVPQQEHKKSGGIGLVNVQRRLNLIYPDKYDLKITNTPDTYQVFLSLVLDEGMY